MVRVDKEKCVGCGECMADCLAFNIVLEEDKASVKGECIECGHCVALCPMDAVSIEGYDMEDVEEYDASSFEVNPDNLLRAIKFRRSIRFFKEEKVKKEDLQMLLQAGRYTATAKNNQDCHFIFVQEEREELKERVWGFIDAMGKDVDKQLLPFVAFNRRRLKNPADDYLFRNAPVVLYIASDWPLDAGLAAQNIETLANAMGMGALYNGFLSRISDANVELKKWLGIEDKTIKACLLLGYPDRTYRKTAPRKDANVIWK